MNINSEGQDTITDERLHPLPALIRLLFLHSSFISNFVNLWACKAVLGYRTGGGSKKNFREFAVFSSQVEGM